jgi:hypothetical protein
VAGDASALFFAPEVSVHAGAIRTPNRMMRAARSKAINCYVLGEADKYGNEIFAKINNVSRKVSKRNIISMRAVTLSLLVNDGQSSRTSAPR